MLKVNITVLGILMVILSFVLVGCGMNADNNTVSSHGNVPEMNQVTLEQAQSKVPFHILLPHDLPADMTLKLAQMFSGTLYVVNPVGDCVELEYASSKDGIILYEQKGEMGKPFKSEEVSKIKVNGIDAEYRLNKNQFEATLIWKNGDVVCTLRSNNKDSDISTEQGLLKIATSVQ